MAIFCTCAPNTATERLTVRKYNHKVTFCRLTNLHCSETQWFRKKSFFMRENYQIKYLCFLLKPNCCILLSASWSVTEYTIIWHKRMVEWKKNETWIHSPLVCFYFSTSAYWMIKPRRNTKCDHTRQKQWLNQWKLRPLWRPTLALLCFESYLFFYVRIYKMWLKGCK